MVATNGTAVVFPGQGSQRTGMARDFYLELESSRRTFEEASDASGLDLAALCFEPDARLGLTEFTQPALLTAEVAMYRGLRDEMGLCASYFGGHSLGEYSALVAADVLPLASAVQLVRLRGRLMQSAAPPGSGGMVVLCAPDIATHITPELARTWDCDVACCNSPNQIVLAGTRAALATATEAAVALTPENLDVVVLDVSAPFHCRQQAAIVEGLRAALLGIGELLCPERASHTTCNATGRFHRDDLTSLVDALAAQVSCTVRWSDNMQRLCDVADPIYEIGPSRPLSSLFASLGRKTVAITSLRAARKESFS